MATKKDLVEAYAFSRRRLVTAFVSGAPGGREVEPARPGRVLVGGAALAVLLLAGAAIAGVLKPRAQADWEHAGLVTDERGALYAILDADDAGGQPRLRSVINVTSAQLILNADVKAVSLPADDIARQPKGPPLGILGAPATVPRPEDLVNSGWTSCTHDGAGMVTHVAPDPDVSAEPTTGFVVRGSKGDRWLIAEADDELGHRAYRYRVPGNDDSVLTAVSPNPVTHVVPDEWISLLPEGGSLDLKGLGATTSSKLIDSNGTYYLQNGKDTYLLSEFAYELAQALKVPASSTVPAGALGDMSPNSEAHWPRARLEGSAPEGTTLCGVLETAPGQAPAVRLAYGDDAALDGVTDSSVSVSSGNGALVRSADWLTTSGGSPHLIDDRGRAYVIAGDDEVARLGYAAVPAVVVPDVWLKRFTCGPELSREAALSPPASSEGKAASCS